jgi:hypothetical protein
VIPEVCSIELIHEFVPRLVGANSPSRCEQILCPLQASEARVHLIGLTAKNGLEAIK